MQHNHVMRRIAATRWCVIVLCLIGMTNALSWAQTAHEKKEAVKPIVNTSLPGDFYTSGGYRLPDGTLFAWLQVDPRRLGPEYEFGDRYNTIFLASPEDPTRWSDVGLRNPFPKTYLKPVGGDRERLYFLVRDYNDTMRQLYAFDIDAGGKVLTNMPSIRANQIWTVRFASKVVGAIADGADIQLTTDGGQSWRVAYTVGNDEQEALGARLLGWIDDHRLLLAWSHLHKEPQRKIEVLQIELLERKGDLLKRAWITEPNLFERAGLPIVGRDAVWVDSLRGSGDLAKLDLANGQVVATIDYGRLNYEGAADCHGRFLFWRTAEVSDDPVLMPPEIRRSGSINPGWRTWVSVWEEVRAGEYARVRTVNLSNLILPSGDAPYVATVAPLTEPDCLVFFKSGEAARLNVQTGEVGPLMPLHVGVAPPPFEPRPTKEQTRLFLRLLDALPEEQRSAILSEFSLRYDLSPQERVEQQIKRIRDVLAGVNPVHLKDPSRPSPWLVRAAAQIAVHLSADVCRSIAADAFGDADLTYTQQMDLVIDQILKTARDTFDESDFQNAMLTIRAFLDRMPAQERRRIQELLPNTP